MPTPHNCYSTNATLVCILSYIKSAVTACIFLSVRLDRGIQSATGMLKRRRGVAYSSNVFVDMRLADALV